ncbi:putative WD-repeat protein [Paragonimus heterotremus]|uniref:Protein HIRA n=1 Tax=Paragonimus heterotremus TaxID=100268 RepID=A0A8J4TCH7_9TREM|nr:putative WD-repeat protein [Paragonimus heterotremus]
MKLLKPVWVSHGSLSKDNSLGRPIYSLDMHPDGTRLATGGLIDTCGVVILWNMAPIRNPKLETNVNIPRKLFQMDSHQACVNCVRWSPTGRWLASAGMDKVVMLWKKTSSASRHTTVFGSKEQTTFTEHWRCSTVLRGHAGDIIDLAWSHDEYRLASAGVDNSVIVWCRQTNPEVPTVSQFVMLTTLRANQGFVKGVAWDPVGRYLASQGDEISVKVWRTADWKEEAVIRKPFVKAVGQSQVMRMSWSLDGSTLAAPHAINNGFPTAKLIDRTNWVPAFDLVGHRKHVICARYCPNLFRKAEKGGTQDLVCLALGSKDRSVSVWTTADRRALVVIHDLFTNSVCDLTWSSSGTELMACSLDGTVSYMGFTDVELGSPWSTADLVQLHHKSYGQSLFDKLISTETVGSSQDLPISVSVSSMGPKLHGGVNQTNFILETPEALALQQSRANVCQRLNEPLTDASSTQSQRPAPLGPSKQIETRGKDGRRRIIPKFLGHLDSLDEDANSNPQFSSSQSNQNNRSASTPDDSCSSAISLKPSGQSNHITESPKLNGTTAEQTQRDVGGQKSLPSGSSSTNGYTTGLACDPRTSPDKMADQAAKLSKETTSTSSSSFPAPPSCVTISVNGPSTPSREISSAGSNNQNKRSFTEVEDDDIVPGQASDESSKVKSLTVGKQKKRRRVRLFDSSDEPVSVNTNEKKPSAQTKSGSNSLSETGLTHSSPRSKGQIVADSDTTNAHDSRLTGATASSLPSVTTLPLITVPDQLANESKVKFVCSHPVEGPILIELAGRSPTQSSTLGPSRLAVGPQAELGIYRVTAYRNDRTLWEVFNEHRLTCYAYTDYMIFIGDVNGRIQSLHSNGTRVCPPLLSNSSVHLLSLTTNGTADRPISGSTFTPGSTCVGPTSFSRLHTVVSGGDTQNSQHTLVSNQKTSVTHYRLVALYKCGRLLTWHISLPSEAHIPNSVLYCPSTFPQLVVETNLREIIKGPPASLSSYSSLTFSSDGHPVVHRRDGSSYLFHMDSRTWFELFDASNKTRCAVASSAIRNCPFGPLASCQLLNKIVTPQLGQIDKLNDLRSDNSPADQRLIVQRFLEAQTHNAKLFGSAAEYRYWFNRWFRTLVEDNQEEQIRRICQDLIGPVFGNARSSWQPTIKGISKHELMKELLTLFALNLRLQRLYVETKETLEQCQLNHTPTLYP